MIYVFLFVMGSIFGSFMNVCIYRMPREEKIGMSRSRCPHCKRKIAWYDNIPFFSFIILRAKCRHCHGPISLRYFIVEFIGALSLCLLWWIYGNSLMTAVFFVYIAFLIIGSFIDLEFMIIPDAITIGGLVLGLVTCAVFPQIMNEYVWWKGLLKSFVGAMAGGISLFLIAEIASFIYKKEAMGMGDVKLLAMIGSFIGWKWALFTIFTSSLLGTIAGVILIFAGKAEMKGKIPFGPYLALGSVISLLWGKDIVNWYLKMLG